MILEGDLFFNDTGAHHILVTVEESDIADVPLEAPCIFSTDLISFFL